MMENGWKINVANFGDLWPCTLTFNLYCCIRVFVNSYHPSPPPPQQIVFLETYLDTHRAGKHQFHPKFSDLWPSQLTKSLEILIFSKILVTFDLLLRLFIV